MQSEDPSKKDSPHLSPDNYYRQQLSDLKNQDGYNETVDDSSSVAGLAGLALMGGSALLAYETGAMRAFTNKFVSDFATSQGLHAYSAMYDALSDITSDKKGNIFTNIVDISNNNTISAALEKSKVESLKSSMSVMENLETIKFVKERYKVIRELEAQRIDDQTFNILRKNTADDLWNVVKTDNKVEAGFMKKIGLRHATFQDLMDKNMLSDADISRLSLTANEIPEIMKGIADRKVFINEAGKIVDIRKSVSSVKKMGRSFVNDFQIPMLGINPIKMFKLDEVFNLSEHEVPSSLLTAATDIQPSVTKKVTSAGASYVYSHGNVYDTIRGKQVAKDTFITRANGGYFASNYRKMVGVEVVTHGPKSNTKAGKMMYNLAEAVGLGFQDERYRTQFKANKIDTYIPSFFQKMNDKFSPVQTYEKAALTEAFGKGNQWLIMPKAKKLGQKGALKQFVGNRKNIDNITSASMPLYMLGERLNRGLQVFNLGLPQKYLGSVGGIFTGIMGTRILPVVAGIAALKYIDYALEKKDGTSPKDVITDAMANADSKIAGIREKLGANDKLERFKEVSPGVEFLAEIPFLGKIFDSKNEQEAKEHWDNGYTPIRKGRWWSLGNTPYGGGRIEYFRPNMKRRVQSDYKYTDVKFGSKKEYWQNHFLPNPTNPLAPVKHFFTDPYHWEEKHYDTRPYPITGGIAELKEIPLIGGFVNASVGKVIKPQKKMHTEYWTDDGSIINIKTVENTPWQSLSRPGTEMQGDPGKHNIPEYKASSYNNVAYSTSSGLTSTYAIPSNVSIGALNNKLKESSIQKVEGISQIRSGSSKYGPYEESIIRPYNPEGLVGAFENLAYDTTEMAGFYGYSSTLVTGDPFIKGPRLATSSSMNSYADAFWDESLGGLGGDLSEIFRRFAPNTPYDVTKNEINPIRNKMPTWMPGKEYFIDFLHGDPYEKVKEGEYRLPGQGFEAMYKMDDPMKMKIKASSLGYDSPEVYVKDILHIDDLTIGNMDGAKENIQAVENSKNRVKLDWYNTGLALSVNVDVEDKERGITGTVDAIVRDKNSKKGYAASQFVVLDGAQFDNMLAKRSIVTPQEDELNFYLGQLGLNKGYVNYINKDNWRAPVVSKAIKYDKQRDSQYLENINQSRGIVNSALDNNIIQRGDLYDPISRFKILGDVAPYSENYRHYQKIIDNMNLTEAEQKEVDGVTERVSKVKEKIRITPYKFKTADIEKRTVTIDKVLDNGTVLVKGMDNPLKLAGLNFSTTKEDAGPQKKVKILGHNFKYGGGEVDNKTMQLLRRRLRSGSKIEIGINADELRRTNRDTYKTISAVFDVNDKTNLNKMLIERGYAEENKKDDSATGIHARYSKKEIAYGSLFETISHRDTPFHTKFMQARSALEQYERRDVYGKDWQSWAHPIDDFLVPSFQNTIRKNPLLAAGTGAFIGSLFGRTNTGKIIGGTIGASLALGGAVAVKTKEAATGKAYIPKRREKEREMNEYIDMLKYVKNRKLYETYRQLSIKQDGVDPNDILQKNKEEGDYRKRKVRSLEKFKRDINNKNITLKEAREKAKFSTSMTRSDVSEQIGERLERVSNKEAKLEEELARLKSESRQVKLKVKDGKFKLKRPNRKKSIRNRKRELKEIKKERKSVQKTQTTFDSGVMTKKTALKKLGQKEPRTFAEITDKINGELNRLKSKRKADDISPLAAQAIMYYNESEKTAYGYDSGEPVQNMLAALNRKERKYFMPFLEAPEKERKKILRIAPSYMKRALQSSYGMKVDEKVGLDEYFSKHFLPDENWAGWQPDVNMDDVKIKMVKHEAMDASEFDIWSDDEVRAKHLDIPIPKINHSEGISSVRTRLQDVLSNSGLENIEVNVSQSDAPGVSMNMNIENDRRGDIEDYINSYGIF